MSETWVDDFTHEEKALEQLLMRPGLRVFVGRREGNRARSAVMAGRHDVPYFRAINCVGANHAERAARYVAAYYAAHARKQPDDTADMDASAG